ncbi:MAG: hypothetical protein QOG85_2228 [Gaiellaceae bacterium]|jgi:hypothetical protein|nr:hypothetical protein [Gaiellaceae bacterium]
MKRKGERKIVTLSDGVEVELRKLNHYDWSQIRDIEPVAKQTMAALALAAVRPRIEYRGQAPIEPIEDVIHVGDLSNDDLELLAAELNDFSLGGAEAARFREADNGGPVADRPDIDEVSHAATRGGEPPH